MSPLELHGLWLNDPSLTPDQRRSRLEDHLLEAMKDEVIEVPRQVLESGNLVEWLEAELEKQT